jgi:hypothetical protein
MQIADCKIAVFQEICNLPQTAEFGRKGADFRVQPFWGKPETCRRLQNPPGRVQISEYSLFAETETCRRLQSLAGRVQISEYSLFAEI